MATTHLFAKLKEAEIVQEKYNSMKTEFNEIESENLRLQSLCKQKDQEVTDMLKVRFVWFCKMASVPRKGTSSFCLSTFSTDLLFSRTTLRDFGRFKIEKKTGIAVDRCNQRKEH